MVCELVVVTPEGVALPGVGVVAYGPNGPPPTGPTQPKYTDRLDAAVTDHDGIARFRRIGIGTRYLVLEDGVPADLAIARAGKSPVRQVRVDVTPSMARETLRLQRFSCFQGSIVSEQGVPSAYAGFFVSEGGEGGKKRLIQTNAAGNFLIHLDNDGPWVITQLLGTVGAQETHDIVGTTPELISDPVLWARGQSHVITYRR
jgi:hypothetical protein